MVRSYRDLRVWQQAMTLAESTYRVTRAFPREEMFGLTSQAHRAAVSIPSNIAEGHSRGSSADFLRFLYVSLASLSELETHMELSKRLLYCSPPEHEAFIGEASSLGRQLHALRHSLRNPAGPRPPAPGPQ